MPKWLKISLKCVGWLIVVILLIPVLLYVPPIQTWIKNIATDIVHKSTGMTIGIERFRLKWPVDIALDGVNIIEATGDTMVFAQQVDVDVKLWPLFKLDVDINEVKLEKAGIRIMSPDSSMLLKLKADLINIDGGSSVDIKKLDVDISKVLVKGGNLQLDMDVWKKVTVEQDTTPPLNLKIFLHEADIEDFTFNMSMLPTIDSLNLKTKSVILREGVIDLGSNLITANYLGTSDGNVNYISPTPEYIKEHPAPIDSVPSATPPIIIKGDTLQISDFSALYAVKDAKPLPGFDPSYIDVSNVNIKVDSFYNEASTVVLPISEITATERSGLAITKGEGEIKIDSIGLNLKDLSIQTPFSSVEASATFPFDLMELKPYAPFNLDAEGSVGWPDVEAFMPTLKSYTSKIPQRSPLDFDIVAGGSLDNIELSTLNINIKNVLGLHASGSAEHAFDIKKLDGKINFSGEVASPHIVDELINMKDFKVPALKLKGAGRVSHQVYSADFDLETTVGSVVADGSVALTSEKYRADVSVKDLDIRSFLPDLNIGRLSATLTASGAGFNPTKSKASTDISLDIQSIDYNKTTFRNISANVLLENGQYKIDFESPNEAANFSIKAEGTLAPDLYSIDLDGELRKLDIYTLGFANEETIASGEILLKGTASPEKWLYDIGLCMKNTEFFHRDQFYSIPNDVDLNFKSTFDNVTADVSALKTQLSFESASGLKKLIDSFSAISDSIGKQIERKDLKIAQLQKDLPPFSLALEASGNGALGDLLAGAGMSVASVSGRITNDSVIGANFKIMELANSSLRADTLTLNIKQRGELLDYRAHMGNRKNNPLADFANVNLNGYVGNNRLMLGLNQKNQTGETGYRLGLTAAFADSLATIHFTPLKAMIGYIPWTFNSDNIIEVNMKNFRIDADLVATSPKSSILLKTEPSAQGNDELHLAMDNIQIQDFLRLPVFAPPITAGLNMDLRVGYYDSWLYGNGQIGITDFTYDKLRVGNFNLSLRAGRNDDGSTGARLALKIDGKNAMSAKALLEPDSAKMLQLSTLQLDLTRFPLSIANPFLGKDMLSLSGFLNGDFNVSGSLKQPKLNGYLACDSVGVYIPMMASSLKFNEDSISVTDNVIDFNKFDIWGANKNPLEIDGTIDINSLSAMMFDLKLSANNFQLLNNNNRARSELYGKLFFDLNASAKGPLEHFSINGNLNILSSTDVTYSIPQTTAQLTSHNTSNIVRFVNFNDTLSIQHTDTVQSSISMRIVAGLTIENGTQVQVIYPGSTTTGSARIEIQPNGSLHYFQNYLGDTRLNGDLYLGNGYASYSMPIVGEKKFVFNPESYVRWNGELLDPSFNISATDDVRASVIENGNSRIVNFLVEVDITNRLSDPKIEFNLNTDDDMSIRNELQSMTPNARSMAALNMLLTGQYSGAGVKTASSDILQGTMYNILTSTINGWLANNVKGVDISLGVDQYGNSVNGETGSSTSYSYQLSKSLFNNRFKISVGGNYTTDASADESFSENLISDISFEYMLKQTSNVTMYARLFRHTGYESILEGEITETGGGFLLRRRLSNLKQLFRWGKSKNNLTQQPPSMPLHQPDSIKVKRTEEEK